MIKHMYFFFLIKGNPTLQLSTQKSDCGTGFSWPIFADFVAHFVMTVFCVVVKPCVARWLMPSDARLPGLS